MRGVTTTTGDASVTYVDTFDLTRYGLRMGVWARLRYCVLVILGKRRNYPICVCAFGRDDDDE